MLGLCTIVLSTLHATIKANKNPGKKKKKASSSNLGVVVDSTVSAFHPYLTEEEGRFAVVRLALWFVLRKLKNDDVETSWGKRATKSL